MPEVAGCLSPGAHPGGFNGQDAHNGMLIPEVAHTLRGDGFDVSEDGSGRGTPLVAVAFSSKDYGADASNDIAPTLRACQHAGSHANGGGPVAVAYAIHGAAIRENSSRGHGNGVRSDDCAFTMEARSEVQAVAFHPRFARNGRGAPDTVAGPLTAEAGRTGKGDSAQCVATPMCVRRLTPTECERLQGFPDHYTRIPVKCVSKYAKRKKFQYLQIDGAWWQLAADGPRYRAIGNSMAVPVMRWIGERIEIAEASQ